MSAEPPALDPSTRDRTLRPGNVTLAGQRLRSWMHGVFQQADLVQRLVGAAGDRAVSGPSPLRPIRPVAGPTLQARRATWLARLSGQPELEPVWPPVADPALVSAVLRPAHAVLALTTVQRALGGGSTPQRVAACVGDTVAVFVGVYDGWMLDEPTLELLAGMPLQVVARLERVRRRLWALADLDAALALWGVARVTLGDHPDVHGVLNALLFQRALWEDLRRAGAGNGAGAGAGAREVDSQEAVAVAVQDAARRGAHTVRADAHHPWAEVAVARSIGGEFVPRLDAMDQNAELQCERVIPAALLQLPAATAGASGRRTAQDLAWLRRHLDAHAGLPLLASLGAAGRSRAAEPDPATGREAADVRAAGRYLRRLGHRLRGSPDVARALAEGGRADRLCVLELLGRLERDARGAPAA